MKIIFTTFIIISGVLASLQVQAGDEKMFHTASTEPEQIIDYLLKLNYQLGDSSLMDYLASGTPEISERYDIFFTPAYRKAVQKRERDIVSENCNGKYIEGDLCGLDFNPISCAQDVSDEPYLFHTYGQFEDTAIIAYRWPELSEIVATFRLRNVHNYWKLDAVSCADGQQFNWDNGK